MDIILDKNASARHLEDLCEQLLRHTWSSCPAEATLVGIHDYDHELGDVSPDTYLHNAREFRRFVERLESEIDPSALNADQVLDYRLALLLASKQRVILESQKPWETDPSMYASMAIWGCFGLLFDGPHSMDDRVDAMLSRLRQIPHMLDVAKTAISEPSHILIEAAHDTVRGGWSFFKHGVPRIAAENSELQADLLAANDDAIAALEDYDRWLDDSAKPGPDGSYAVGPGVFQQLLYSQHYLTYSPHDLVLLAQKEMMDVEAEIKDLAESIDPSVSWPELIEQLKNDHPPAENLASAYQDAIEAARNFTLDADLVTIPHGERLEVMETPPFERTVYPYAGYMPVPPFGTRKTGYFWVTPVDTDAPEKRQREQLQGHCVYTVPTMAIHEAYPGHHVQLFKASQQGSSLRKQTMSSLTMEGWALYCESMMQEQGFFIDPRARLFQLKNLLWRCCRVIIDVGLHTENMTFDEAVRLLVEKARLEEVNARAEVKRYCSMPTQPLTYLIGKLLLLDLKDRYMRKMGNQYRIKEFHDEFISHGSVPIPLIARNMLCHPVEQVEMQFLRQSA